MKIKKLIALLLVAVMAVFAFASCGRESVNSLVEKADKALLNSKYKLETDVTMTCNEVEYADVFEQMAIDTEMYVDGNNYEITLSIQGISANMIIAADTLYLSMPGYPVKMKAELNAEQLEELLANSTSGIDELGVVSFDTITKTAGDDGETVITCTGIKDDALAAYLESVGESLDGADLKIEDVKLVAVIEDGKYESMSVSMNYTMKIGTESLTVGMTAELDYDYDEGKTITAPSDADSYQSVDYDEMFQ